MIQIKIMALEDIIPYKNNARKNDKAVDVVEKSIKEFGFQNPIIIDKKNEIIAGHTRLRSAKKLKGKLSERIATVKNEIEKSTDPEEKKDLGVLLENLEMVDSGMVPTISSVGLTEEQLKALRLMDNKSGEFAKWDLEMLKVEFEGMQSLEFTGFSEAEIDKIVDPKEKISMGNKIPKYEIKLGDVYKLGDHRIICGDSTKEETYLRLLPKGTEIQCIFTDPPYGVSYSGTNNPNGRSWDVIEGDDMRGDELYDMLFGCFEQLNQYLTKNGAMYVFHASSNQIIFEKALNKAGFQVKQQLIWAKHHILGHSHYHWCHEPMFYCSRLKENPEFFGTRCNKTTLNKIDPETMTHEELKKFVNTIKEQSTVWEIKKDSSKEYIHPTQKPTKLAQRALLNSSRKGDVCMDPFAGSGSTLMACEERKRICYTIELDTDFCSHIIERWENKTGKKARKLTELELNPGELI